MQGVIDRNTQTEERGIKISITSNPDGSGWVVFNIVLATGEEIEGN